MACVVLVFVALLLPATAIGQQPPQRAAQGPVLTDLQSADSRAFVDKAQLTAAQRKVSSDLRALVGRIGSLGASREAVLANRPSVLSNVFQRVADTGMIQCYVEVDADPESVAARVATVGGKVELISPAMGLVQCELPYDQVENLAADGLVRLVRLPAYAMPRTGAVNSQGDGVHRCNTVRGTYGLTGSGRKVGVISDGINGVSTSQGSGDIPATYEALSARADGDLNAGAEGLAIMEIVHDLAPGAALAFSNPNTSAEMLTAIDILDSTFHCNVICDDLGFSDEPFFEDGPIVTRINQAVANGAIYVSAGGNAADQNYHESDYSGMTRRIGGVSMNVQNFGVNDWNMRAFVPGGGGWIVVIVQWNDPWGGSGNDYDLILTNSSGSTVYAASENVQDGNDKGVEAVGVTNNGSDAYIYVVVRRYSGSNRRLKITSWGYGWFTEYYTATGSVWGHPAASNAIACGAVRWSTPDIIESFSSCGPVRIDFPSLVYRDKPDLCGADGVSVTGNGGFGSPFYGTSAAVPHVAAVCAQVWSANVSQTNTIVRDLVQGNAVDLGASSWDAIYGYGRADALNAANAMDLTISGQVTLDGVGLAGVTMTGLPGDPTTGPSGNYTGTVPFGWSGTVTPSLMGHMFEPHSRSYSSVSSDVGGQDYTAIPGDVDGDGDVDIYDVIDTIAAFGAVPGEANWNPGADFDFDGQITIFDVIDVISHFGTGT